MPHTCDSSKEARTRKRQLAQIGNWICVYVTFGDI